MKATLRLIEVLNLEIEFLIKLIIDINTTQNNKIDKPIDEVSY